MIEIEKKYNLSQEQFEAVSARMEELAVDFQDEIDYLDDETEENILYSASFLNPTQVLRIRKSYSNVMGMPKDVLCYKEPISNEEGIKEQLEIETTVQAYLLEEIFERLGLKPSLVYEKKRSTWTWDKSLVCFDILPFGNFIEIEGTQDDIWHIEDALGITEYAETRSYPTLTKELGKDNNGVIEARF